MTTRLSADPDMCKGSDSVPVDNLGIALWTARQPERRRFLYRRPGVTLSGIFYL